MQNVFDQDSVEQILKTCVILFFGNNNEYLYTYPMCFDYFVDKLYHFIVNDLQQNIPKLLKIECNDEAQLLSYFIDNILDKNYMNKYLHELLIELHKNKCIHYTETTPMILNFDDNNGNNGIPLKKQPQIMTIKNDKIILKVFKKKLYNEYNILFDKYYNYIIHKINGKKHKIKLNKRKWNTFRSDDIDYTCNFDRVLSMPNKKKRRLNDKHRFKNSDIRFEINKNDFEDNKMYIHNGISIMNDIREMKEYYSYKKRKKYFEKQNEILNILNYKSCKKKMIQNLYQTKLGDKSVHEFCPYTTRYECKKRNKSNVVCSKLHFIRIMRAHTIVSSGDCSYLDGCRHMDTCRFVHYTVDEINVELKKNTNKFKARQLLCDLTPFSYDNSQDLKTMSKLTKKRKKELKYSKHNNDSKSDDDMDFENLKVNNILFSKHVTRYDGQWINCDVRDLDFSILGKYGVIMADPAWDIHVQ